MNKTLNYLTLLILGIYTLSLYFSNKLGYYIGERYFSFSIIAGVLITVISLIGLGYYLPIEYRNFTKKQFKFNTVSTLALFGVILLALILPAKTLSTSTAAQRESTINSVNVNTDLNVFQKFGNKTENFTIGEWVNLKNSGANIFNYEDKAVDVTGFVFQPSGLENNQFMISRFQIACCAVDATPVGLFVEYNWQDEFKQDEWVNIKGVFNIKNINGEDNLVIIPETINKVDIPEEPYIN